MYVEHAARYQPDEPPAFKPASLLIRAELAEITHHIPGYPGTLADLISDGQEMADFIRDYEPGSVADMLSTLCRVLDEVNGLLK